MFPRNTAVRRLRVAFAEESFYGLFFAASTGESLAGGCLDATAPPGFGSRLRASSPHASPPQAVSPRPPLFGNPERSFTSTP